MVLPKQTNDCGSNQRAEAGVQAARALSPGAMSPVGNQGGVENPGGLFNTSDDPRVGGSVEKPGGLFNTSLSERVPHPNPRPGGEGTEETPEEEPAYIPRVVSP